MCLKTSFSAWHCMTTSESKGRFFLQNESIRITNRIDFNRELDALADIHKQGNHRYQTPAPVWCCPLVNQFEFVTWPTVSRFTDCSKCCHMTFISGLYRSVSGTLQALDHPVGNNFTGQFLIPCTGLEVLDFTESSDRMYREEKFGCGHCWPVDAFDNNKNLAPWSVADRSTVKYGIAQLSLQINHVYEHTPKQTPLQCCYDHRISTATMAGGLVAEWLACWTQAQKHPRFKLQSRRCRVTVLVKLFTPIVPLFTKQQTW